MADPQDANGAVSDGNKNDMHNTTGVNVDGNRSLIKDKIEKKKMKYNKYHLKKGREMRTRTKTTRVKLRTIIEVQSFA